MVQCGEEMSLSREACDALGIPVESVGNDLDRDRSVEPGVAGFVDFAAATCAERTLWISYGPREDPGQSRGSPRT